MEDPADYTEVVRPLRLMTTDVNGLRAEEETRVQGLRRQRWTGIKSTIERNGIQVVGLQEHHSKSHSDMDSDSLRLRGRQWDYVGNISRSLKSGVMILWLKDRWKLVNSTRLALGRS